MPPRAKSRPQPSDAKTALPLTALLSQALVAYTIEFDNEAEHHLPHSTTRHGSTSDASTSDASTDGIFSAAPWLVSMAMYLNCMQYIGPEGLTIRELVRKARTKTNFRGMARWGYITIRPNPDLPKSTKPDADWIVRAKPAGEKAQQIWRPLFALIEDRWRERFGVGQVRFLRDSLENIVTQLDPRLPDCMPILGFGLRTFSRQRAGSLKQLPSSNPPIVPKNLPLPALLARALLTLVIEFEAESEISLAICANILRLVGKDDLRLRDLPGLSGVSKETIAMAMTFLTNQGYAIVETESSSSRAKILFLTPKGRKAEAASRRILGDIEARLPSLLGPAAVPLRQSLESIVGDGTTRSPLFAGLIPYPDGWRASVTPPTTLPHFPAVLHRGGYPDGS